RVKAEHSTVGPCSANGASNSRPEAPARHELDLCVDVTKLPLNIANRGVGGYLIRSQPHHLLRPLVFHSSAIECECVAVAGDRFRLGSRSSLAVIATVHRVVARVQISLSPSVLRLRVVSGACGL